LRLELLDLSTLIWFFVACASAGLIPVVLSGELLCRVRFFIPRILSLVHYSWKKKKKKAKKKKLLHVSGDRDRPTSRFLVNLAAARINHFDRHYQPHSPSQLHIRSTIFFFSLLPHHIYRTAVIS
jgi:hypothetical protein